jgi:SAM-dependent methyltransferase
LSLARSLVSLLRCPGCLHQTWDLRATGEDDLARLEGTLCCGNCGQAFAAHGGVLDMVPGIVEDRLSALRRRLESPPVAKLYEERLRHFLTPLSSSLRADARADWLRSSRPRGEVRALVDLGCGRGADLRTMLESCRPKLAVGVDLSHVLLAEAAREARAASLENVVFVRANIADLPFRDASFGWASAFGVLHRLEQPAAVLQRIASILEPEAVFTCLTTHRLEGGSKSLGQHLVGRLGQIHLFDRERLEVMLDEACLELQRLEPFGSVSLLTARRCQG